MKCWCIEIHNTFFTACFNRAWENSTHIKVVVNDPAVSWVTLWKQTIRSACGAHDVMHLLCLRPNEGLVSLTDRQLRISKAFGFTLAARKEALGMRAKRIYSFRRISPHLVVSRSRLKSTPFPLKSLLSAFAEVSGIHILVFSYPGQHRAPDS